MFRTCTDRVFDVCRHWEPNYAPAIVLAAAILGLALSSQLGSEGNRDMSGTTRRRRADL